MLWLVKFTITTHHIHHLPVLVLPLAVLLSAAWACRSVPRLIQTTVFIFSRSSHRMTSCRSVNSWPHIMLDSVNICFMLSKMGQLRSSDNWCYNGMFISMFTLLALKLRSSWAVLGVTIDTELLLVNERTHTLPVSLFLDCDCMNSCVRKKKKKHTQIWMFKLVGSRCGEEYRTFISYNTG